MGIKEYVNSIIQLLNLKILEYRETDGHIINGVTALSILYPD